jgi:ABC-type polar amino acid transport system ATPase subunit
LLAKVADRVVFMDRGEIIESGAADAFFTAPRAPRSQTFLAKILAH